LTTISPAFVTNQSTFVVEALCASGSFISGSSPMFSGSAGVAGVSEYVIEALCSVNNTRSIIYAFVNEILVDMSGLAEPNPPPPTETGTYGYAFVT